MKYIDEYKNNGAAKFLTSEIVANSKILLEKGISANIMEVCGSHTMAISRYGIRQLLPDNINLISGPGCPVCVTDSGYIDTALTLAKKGITIATFGDMINVPGSKTTLAKERANGANVEVCYSPLHAIELAKNNPNKEVVFLAIGFETTIAPIISMLDKAIENGIKNISILSAFKLVPPALNALTIDPELKIDAFLCPAHASAIIGAKSYEEIVNKFKIPCVIASFEPVEILLGISAILKQLAQSRVEVENLYERVVTYNGNQVALLLFEKYLENEDAAWRGIGVIPNSGLKLKEKYKEYDATYKFNILYEKGKDNKGCECGNVLKGKIKPLDCPLFAKVCNPINPVGPCMVSSEGTCSAYYKYSFKRN